MGASSSSGGAGIARAGGRGVPIGPGWGARGGSRTGRRSGRRLVRSRLLGEFAIHHASTFISKNTALTAFFADERIGVIGIAAYLVDYGSQERRPPDPLSAPTGRSSTKNLELLASYATDAARPVSLGVTYKLVQFRQDCEGDCGTLRTIVGTTHAIDAGLQVVLGHQDALRLGLMVRNAGFKLQLENRDQADPLPTRVHIGASYRIPIPHAGGPQPIDVRVLADLQDEWGQYASPDAHLGVELGYQDLIRIRAGYAFVSGESRGPSVGVGLTVDRIAIDFARVFYESGTFEEPVHFSFRVLL